LFIRVVFPSADLNQYLSSQRYGVDDFIVGGIDDSHFEREQGRGRKLDDLGTFDGELQIRHGHLR
jgi:hypothetical protein